MLIFSFVVFLSEYVKTPVEDADQMEEVLERALGIKEKVTKTRLYTIMERDGLKSRIHLDHVEELGEEFIEFEVNEYMLICCFLYSNGHFTYVICQQDIL